MSTSKYFHFFEQDTTTIALPEKFTYPFYYEPHQLSLLASKQLQKYLKSQSNFSNHFSEIGKMFGVLVVKNRQQKIGFIAAFSGKLLDSNQHAYFVPPVFDMLPKKGYYKTEEEKLNVIHKKIEDLEKNQKYINAVKKLETTQAMALKGKEIFRTKAIAAKKNRKEKRAKIKEQYSGLSLQEKLNHLNQQSIAYKLQKRDLNLLWDEKIHKAKKALDIFRDEIECLKTQRKQQSNALQQYLFSQYQFLNHLGETKNILDIFKNTALQKPPAAAGECAAPKLLQYAFEQGLTPICMAEFWWGKPPESEVRKHQQYYPACQGKCKPILTHMLKGIDLDTNPLLKNPAVGKELKYVYEDEHMVVINKPAEFLSVPGKTITDSVYTRIKQKYPNASGPLIVHRLDMSTSGIMLIALNKNVHQKLQQQFIKRQVKKRYVAILNGIVLAKKGIVELPLRLDIDDRPRQLVCFKHGKPAKTLWKVISNHKNTTKIYFYPITGRTHQLRVHASHSKGLNCAILGDDLYGKKAERLYLHAEHIALKHPVTQKEIQFKVKADF